MTKEYRSNNGWNHEFTSLMWDLCEGQATPEDIKILESMLRSDPIARESYLRFMQIVGQMEWERSGCEKANVSTFLGDLESNLAESSSHSADPSKSSIIPCLPLVEEANALTPGGGAISPTVQQNVHAPFNWVVFGAGIAVTTLFFSIILFALFYARDNSIGPSSELAQKPVQKNEDPQPIAYLTSSNGCSWADSSTLLVSSEHGIKKGDELTLLEGIAEFRLASGVSLSIEGPAGIVLSSPSSLVLKYGKVTAQVPWSAKDFTVFAGVCRFEAYEAEFGVSVVGGRVDAHAFSGKVIASHEESNTDSDGQRFQQSKTNVLLTKALIKQGRALTLINQQEGKVKITSWGKAKPSLFATKLSMAGELPISEAYIKAVRASNPVAYWRFESGKNSAVLSEVPTGCDLNIVGDLRLSGTAGNRVAEFCPGSDCYMVSREPLDSLANTDYSFEMWIKPSHMHTSSIVSGNAPVPVSGIEGHAFMLELQNSGRQQVRGSHSLEHPFTIRFLHRSPPGTRYSTGTSCFSKDSYNVRRWQHVVARKLGEDLELYVDGKLSASAKDTTSLMPNLRLFIGRQGAADNIFQFIGQLDELAIYPRALTPEEIVKHQSAVDWSETKDTTPTPDHSEL